jgi:hypothetical protein
MLVQCAAGQIGMQQVRGGKYEESGMVTAGDDWPGNSTNMFWEDLIELNARKNLKQSGDFQSGHSGQATGQALHLVRQFFIDTPARFIHGRTH